MHKLWPRDDEKRLQFCNWILQSIVDPHLIIFSNEARFHLRGHVASQNNRYWSTENPHLIHDVPLHDEKNGVLCAVTAKRIIGPIFFQDTINAQRYRALTLVPLSDDEKLNGYFQQDSATAHTANESINKINDVFRERIISQGL
ncbi:hypothetical protein C0J52_11885 [Blattella germanica]|nr:hypothetical protein C0J52_11885 [Blattella germanica]